MLVLGAAVAVGFGVTLLATPLAAALARRWDVMDHPDTFLKPHARPTPYLGGLAIGLGWLAAHVAGALAGAAVQPLAMAAVLAGGVIILLIGARDDARHIAPLLRLVLCAAVVAAVLLTAGVPRLEALLPGVAERVPPLLPALAGTVFGVFVVLGACNSTNLIDGLDGLCAGVTAVSALGFMVLGLLLGDAGLLVLLSAGLLGASLGFLPHNFQPARIFMGDAGSLLLGYCSGVLILVLASTGPQGLIAGVLIFGLPIYDTALAMLRRWRNGKPIFEGDRSHFYDQLVQRGFTVRQTALTCYAVAAAFAAIGVLAGVSPLWVALLLALGAAGATGVVSLAAGFASADPTTRLRPLP